MEIFDVYDNEPRINPMGLFIPELRAIWDADKSKDKELATSELLYVYHMGDKRSPYSSYPEDEKESKIIQDYFQEDWTPSETVEIALEKYREMQSTVATRLLEGVKSQMDKMAKWMKESEFDEEKMNQITNAMAKANLLLDSYYSIEKRVNTQVEQGARKFKGGVSPSSILEL